MENTTENSPASESDPRGTRSLIALLFVQTQNAFNDNFVRFVLMGLAFAVAAGTKIGDNIQYILALLITIPFIVFAPISGYFSDRFSKQRVVWYCALLQFALFALVAFAVWFRMIELAIVGFFLLAIQSTLFSPAKQGILKELVGTKRLGFANGLLSMLTMVGILGGMVLSGKWFDSLLASLNEKNGVSVDNAWTAALIPILGIGAFSLTALIGARLIKRTPDHPKEKFSKEVWVRHFIHLKELFQQPILRTTVMFITFYWFIANSMFFSFTIFAKELYSEAGEAGLLSAVGEMMLSTGVGLILGSLSVSFLTRNGNKLFLSVIGSAGMAVGLLGAGLIAADTTAWFVCLGLIGFFSGFLVVPLNAHLQDMADPSKRGRVISALNLLTSTSGLIAAVIGKFLERFGASNQILVFVVPALLIAILIFRSLKSLQPQK